MENQFILEMEDRLREERRVRAALMERWQTVAPDARERYRQREVLGLCQNEYRERVERHRVLWVPVGPSEGIPLAAEVVARGKSLELWLYAEFFENRPQYFHFYGESSGPMYPRFAVGGEDPTLLTGFAVGYERINGAGYLWLPAAPLADAHIYLWDPSGEWAC